MYYLIKAFLYKNIHTFLKYYEKSKKRIKIQYFYIKNKK